MRALGSLVVACVALLGLLLIAGGWHYSGEIRRGALEAAAPEAPEYRVRVLDVDEDTVTLERQESVDGLVTEGVWGLRWADGYGQVREIHHLGSDRVVRDMTHLDGAALQAGDLVDVEGSAYPSDPRTAFGLEYEEVQYPSGLGPTPAWLVAGSRPTWVVFVHGLNSPRKEALRLVGPVAGAGFPALVISYRNDAGAPQTETRLRRWGETEWRDVEAAAEYALDHGASQVALVGYSMGGAVVTSFLYESHLADRAVGAVLDSPTLDFGGVIDLAARQRSLPLVGTPIPPPVTAVAKTFTSWRYDVDWDGLDYVERATELEVPVLVIHGTEDDSVPLATSEAFADARPDLVTLRVFPGAGHVRAWNLDPERYEREVLSFLERVAASEAADPDADPATAADDVAHAAQHSRASPQFRPARPSTRCAEESWEPALGERVMHTQAVEPPEVAGG